MVPFRYNVRSLWARKLTTAATALGLALVVFVYAASLMLTEGVRRAIVTGGRADNVIVLRKGADSELASIIESDDLGAVLAQPQVSQAVGAIGELVMIVTALRNDGTGGVSNLLIRGVSANSAALRPDIRMVEGRAPRPGTGEVMIGRGATGRFLDPSGSGDPIELGRRFDIKRNRPLEVVGVFSAGGSSYESEVWGDLDVIRRVSGREGTVSSVRVRLSTPEGFDAYKQAIERDPRLGLKVQREIDYYADQSSQISGVLAGLGVALAIMFSIAAMLGAAITMNAAVASRAREIGTLRALGFSRWSILASFVLEAITLAALGGGLGSTLVLSLGLVSFHMVNFQTLSDIVIRFTATPDMFASAMIFAGAMGLLGGLGPALRAMRVSPVEAMRA
jgi:putative ABC transport system permease protein